MARLTGNIIRILTVLWLLSLDALVAEAQISGQVIDATSGEPVALATIYYKGTQAAVKADLEGRFQLARRNGLRFVVSSVGYISQEVPVKEATPNQITVHLEPDVHQIQEVTVTSRRKSRYRRKENPAVELMRHVIAAKKRTDISQHYYYQYTRYQKIMAGFNDLQPEDLTRGIFDNRPWLRNHLEVSPYNEKLIMPLFLEETVTDKQYRKTPHFEKDIIRGHRTAGVHRLFQTGSLFNVILEEYFTDIDIYDDQIRLLRHAFTSPIGRDAIIFYHFYITDTTYVGNDRCYQLDFTPANQQDFGFRGQLFVLADSSYQVKRCEMTFPQATDVNWIQNLQCNQEFTKLDNGEWVLNQDDMIAELLVTKYTAKAIIVRNTVRSDFSFAPLTDLRGNGTKAKTKDAEMQPEDFWNVHRGKKLSEGEQSLDLLVDRIEQLKGIQYVLAVARTLFENFIETGSKDHPSKLDIGPVFSTVSSNFYDGLRLRAGGQTTANLHPHLFMKGYYAHAFNSKENYYDAQLIYTNNTPEYLPQEFPRRLIAFESLRDVALPSDKFLATDKDNMFSSVKITDMDKMFLYNRQALKFEHEQLTGLKFYGEMKTEQVSPVGNIAFQPVDLSATPLSSLRYTEGTIGIRYAPGETYVNTKQQRWPLHYDKPVVRLQHTMGWKGFLGGQYHYNFTELELFKRFFVPLNFGKIDTWLKMGAQWNQVPYPLLIMPACNVSFILDENSAFDLINNMEFLNDRYLSLEIGWDLNGKLFNLVPLLKKLRCREHLGAKCLWGCLTDKNNPYLDKNRDSRVLMCFPEGSYVMDPDKPYVELSAGIHNILNLIHIEYIRRLGYLDLPTSTKWTFKFAVDFKF